MKKIALSGKNGIGLFCLVDDEDFDTLSQHKWYWHDGYAITVKHISGSHTKKNIKQKNITMHRLIMGVPEYKTGHIIDHINRNRLDNRKENLRFVDWKENSHNVSPSCNSSSKYKGVRYNNEKRKWVAHCKGKYLGSFSDEKMAALFYDRQARKYFGEYAYLNFPAEKLSDDFVLPRLDPLINNRERRKSKYLGVSYFGHGGKRVKRWRSVYKKKTLGYFHTEREAANAYAEARGISLEDCK